MNLIVAVTKDFAIGRDNNLLCHIPSDLAYFKKMTTGKVVIFGKNTYFSLPKQPLPNRTNIVLCSNPNFKADGAIVVHSLNELFGEINKYDPQDVFVCGGASVYNKLMPYCDKAYVTMINNIVPADTYIKDLTKEHFYLLSETTPQTENGQEFCFQVYKNENVKVWNTHTEQLEFSSPTTKSLEHQKL